MTNTPRASIPINTGGDDQVPSDTAPARPAPDTVTPSQQGQFQGALERKTDDKGGKETKKTPGTPAKKTGGGAGVFQLAATRKAQGEDLSADVGTGEESLGEQGFLPKKKAAVQPSAEQVAAAGQMAAGQVVAGQAQVVSQPVSTTSPRQTRQTGTPVAGMGTQTGQRATGFVQTGTTGRPSVRPTTTQLAPSAETLVAGTTTTGTGEAPPMTTPRPTTPARPKASPTVSMTSEGPTTETTEALAAPQTPTATPTVAPRGGPARTAQKTTGGAASGAVTGRREAVAAAASQVGAQAKPEATPTVQTEAPVETPQSRQAAMVQLITQAAEAIATFVSKDVTSTVVTIRQPPIFEGATLTVTEYSTAPQQFNITFGNLSPEARRMIESVANQQQLKQALIDRGYTIQNIVIESTPQKAEPIITTEAAGGQGAGGQEGGGGEGAGEGAGEAEGGVT